MKILITGSRQWPESKQFLVHAALTRALGECLTRNPPEPLEVWHGDARGADAMASLWCQLMAKGRHGRWVVERKFPADWDSPCTPDCRPGHRRARKDGSEYCPSVGMYRNQEMVDAKPDRVYAFNKAKSAGTTRCAGMAREASIPVTEWTLG